MSMTQARLALNEPADITDARMSVGQGLDGNNGRSRRRPTQGSLGSRGEANNGTVQGDDGSRGGASNARSRSEGNNGIAHGGGEYRDYWLPVQSCNIMDGRERLGGDGREVID